LIDHTRGNQEEEVQQAANELGLESIHDPEEEGDSRSTSKEDNGDLT
jgi:hypothetical protein